MNSTPDAHLRSVTWHKSSYSAGDGGDCLEVAVEGTVVPVRDSKNPHGPNLLFRADAWAAFVSDLKEAPASK
ncbi:DUF397 domain-containing protein [Streptomyces sp. BB1-1-1]|uniref:DUF397 domain-containing protein n=1 Tax=Streptomyces sp. BB1-1-1 TaxID=3074430 RepID=UPI002877872B|nr:DUF397 domain-containing protein [Streptomyces sp. BB1-1-1]WND36848.1 DUF397 domain-containing protein [Streptomyces sp. BB1-1-1]